MVYDFKKVEEEVLKFWKEKKIYDKVKKKNKKGKRFYFLQGPPYTSGRLHIGHAWNNSLKDVVLRYKRMRGFNVWDRAGYDMHGLPTENAVQKKLGIKDKLGIEEYGVEKFIKECIKFSSENAKLMDKDLERLGVWMDFENAYWPIKKEFIEGEWWLIKKAYEQKRLYKGKKIMHWCAECETSLAKHELEYENIRENSIFLKFKVKNKAREYLVIWTTTPWTIPFNLAVMVNPELEYVRAEVETENGKEIWVVAKALANVFISGLMNYKLNIIEESKGNELEGLEYLHPLHNELGKIYDELKRKWKKVHTVILSKEYVDISAGSGLVHSAPGCGPEDFEVCQKYAIGAFNLLDEKGYFNGMGEFDGLRAKKDDDKIIEIIKKSRSLIKETEVEHEYAHCWRCHNPVIYRATEQWFMKIEDLIPKLLDFNKKINWQPKFASKNYDLWIENLKDNGITRQRYWGCPVPIWVCECGDTEVIGSVNELKKKGGKIPNDLHKPWIDDVKIRCKKCGNNMMRVPDVIDVWVDSGTTSWNCLYYPKEKKYFKFWPADFILEATEQIKLWFSMLQMCSGVAFGKSSYKNVYCHGMILDYQGMKMSKSLGNIISPYEVVDKYGADVLRYYMCETPAGENINFNWETVKMKQRNLNVLYNLANFLKDLKKQGKENKKIDLEEKFILSKKNSTIKKVTELMEEYKIDEIIKEIENLFLDLSRVYIQLVRDKVNSEPGKVLFVVNNIYNSILKMFSIICPFITDEVWLDLKKEKIVKEDSVHLCSWPKYDEKKIDKKLEEKFETLGLIIKEGMAQRENIGYGVRWPLSKAEIKIKDLSLLKNMDKLLKMQLNVKEIKASKGEFLVRLDEKITKELEVEGYTREVMRRIQSLRKKEGLKKEDRIKLIINSDYDLSRFKEEIMNKVGAKSIEFNEKTLGISSKENIKDKEFEISIQKV
ncbi:isoleucine--tRNA ligase [Candidatus Woesearchaeota archaeon]|nr:isoleucine--tRNA ligase [Candidatus Woesearchaeota archaeon]